MLDYGKIGPLEFQILTRDGKVFASVDKTVSKTPSYFSRSFDDYDEACNAFTRYASKYKKMSNAWYKLGKKYASIERSMNAASTQEQT